jgi:hypothetical protein
MEASETSSTSNGSGQSPWAAHEAIESNAHPELAVLGAFVGGFVLAKIIRAIGGGNE